MLMLSSVQQVFRQKTNKIYLFEKGVEKLLISFWHLMGFLGRELGKSLEDTHADTCAGGVCAARASCGQLRNESFFMICSSV